MRNTSRFDVHRALEACAPTGERGAELPEGGGAERVGSGFVAQLPTPAAPPLRYVPLVRATIPNPRVAHAQGLFDPPLAPSRWREGESTCGPRQE